MHVAMVNSNIFVSLTSLDQQVMADCKVTIVVLHVTMQKVDVAMGSMGFMDNYSIYIVLSQTVLSRHQQMTQDLLMGIGKLMHQLQRLCHPHPSCRL